MALVVPLDLLNFNPGLVNTRPRRFDQGWQDVFLVAFIPLTRRFVLLTQFFYFLACKRKFGWIGKSLILKILKIGDIGVVAGIFIFDLVEFTLVLGQLQWALTF